MRQCWQCDRPFTVTSPSVVFCTQRCGETWRATRGLRRRPPGKPLDHTSNAIRARSWLDGVAIAEERFRTAVERYEQDRSDVVLRAAVAGRWLELQERRRIERRRAGVS